MSACDTYPHAQTRSLVGIIIPYRILFHQTPLKNISIRSLILLDSAKDRQIIHTCKFLQSGVQENNLKRRRAGHDVHTQIYPLI